MFCILCAFFFELIFTQAPFWDVGSTNETKLEESYRYFCEMFPAFHLLGTVEHPPDYTDIEETEGTQLVCKYFKSYERGSLDVITYGAIVLRT